MFIKRKHGGAVGLVMSILAVVVDTHTYTCDQTVEN